MTKSSAWKTVCAALLFCAATTIASHAQTFTTLATFDGSNGSFPASSLVQGTDGNFYGTTSSGGNAGSYWCGSYGCGTVFKITPSGVLTTIYKFCPVVNCKDGWGPGQLILANDGNFYGTTFFGFGGLIENCCSGTLFRVTPAGNLTTLYNFCSLANCADGDFPQELLQGNDGNLYGTTSDGGSGPPNTNCCGTVFKFTRSRTLTTLYDFSGGTDGWSPDALIQVPDGNFYGTTNEGGFGGTTGQGTVFKLSSAGLLTTLYDFCSQANCPDGQVPSGQLLRTTSGVLVGTTIYGGTSSCSSIGCGTIFGLTPSGRLEYEGFNGVDGYTPIAGVIQATDGNLYGVTDEGVTGICSPGCGNIFELTPGGAITTLYNFDASNANPYGGLLLATNGIFYGTTAGDYGNGTVFYGDGTVYSLSTGLGPFVTFMHAAGKVGQTGGILGQGFTGTTSVSLNGILANFTVVSDTFIKATVPTGATTGYVTVTTPSGTLTSNVPFHVLK